MIARYTRPEMGILWDAERRFKKMLEVEIAVAQAQAVLGIIPKKAAQSITQKSQFNVRRIEELEKETKHDVIAFVSNIAENVGVDGKYVHFGMTSSDVLDTAFSLQIREAGDVLLTSIEKLEGSLMRLSQKTMGMICPGRTHGMFAEPTTFGYKILGYYEELIRNKERVLRAIQQASICKLSGAVGTYSGQPPEVEALVAKTLKLTPENVATQVVPRDRHAEVIISIAMLGAGLERLSVELRHLQRNEVGEVVEGFTKGQKGSSAMPHKKNPISAENITGASRILRSYVIAAMENIVLWHERDISHSSVERVMFPDVFILADYALNRMVGLVDHLGVNEKRMKDNVEMSQGQLYSSQVLLALVQKGLSREEAYSHVQRLSHSLGPGEHLRKKIEQDNSLRKILGSSDLEDIFSGERLKNMIISWIKKRDPKRKKKHGSRS